MRPGDGAVDYESEDSIVILSWQVRDNCSSSPELCTTQTLYPIGSIASPRVDDFADGWNCDLAGK